MNLSELLKKNLVEEFESDPDQIGNEIDGAEKNLSSAKNMCKISEWEWAHSAAYNAMLHTGRALMFAKGYRPRGPDHHVAVVDFMEAVFSSKIPKNIRDAFEMGRKLRHEFTYDKIGIINTKSGRNQNRKRRIAD
jgi:uncharacterized protein (UPF0332 family)